MSNHISSRKLIYQTKIVFVAWTQVSRRSAELARKFKAEYFRLERVDYPFYHVIIKLFTNSIRTLLKFLKTKPTIIFTFQAHPLITCVAIIYKIFSGSKVIPDLHTAAYTDYDRFPINVLNYFLWRNSDVVLVHNQSSFELLSNRHISLKQKLFVLEDPIPEFAMSDDLAVKKWKKLMKTAVLVSRFAADEPIQSFLEAATQIRDVHFYITGDSTKARFPLTEYSGDNITFTGFLPDDEYISLLRSVDFVIALTTREYTLLSAGYEALALGKPLIVSETETLRDYFEDSVIYFSNDPNCIKEAIVKVMEQLNTRIGNIQSIRQRKLSEWGRKREQLLQILLGPEN